MERPTIPLHIIRAIQEMRSKIQAMSDEALAHNIGVMNTCIGTDAEADSLFFRGISLNEQARRREVN